jgi:hypothetical protein
VDNAAENGNLGKAISQLTNISAHSSHDELPFCIQNYTSGTYRGGLKHQRVTLHLLRGLPVVFVRNAPGWLLAIVLFVRPRIPVFSLLTLRPRDSYAPDKPPIEPDRPSFPNNVFDRNLVALAFSFGMISIHDSPLHQ